MEMKHNITIRYHVMKGPLGTQTIPLKVGEKVDFGTPPDPWAFQIQGVIDLSLELLWWIEGTKIH